MPTTASRGLPALLVAIAVATGACASQAAPAADAPEPAHVEDASGSDPRRVTLSPEAATRLGIATAETLAEGSSLVVPHGAIFYDPDGGAWVYVEEVEPLTYKRHPVEVDVIDGDLATLRSGPAAGSKVVSTGVAELYGTEFEIGH